MNSELSFYVMWPKINAALRMGRLVVVGGGGCMEITQAAQRET